MLSRPVAPSPSRPLICRITRARFVECPLQGWFPSESNLARPAPAGPKRPHAFLWLIKARKIKDHPRLTSSCSSYDPWLAAAAAGTRQQKAERDEEERSEGRDQSASVERSQTPGVETAMLSSSIAHVVCACVWRVHLPAKTW
ncbi:hypothetical protein PRIPAC_87955 [Pristionchus pacificus]|uniref:Uncharacterized protein n=1 Tax=Pristionchus pacificus TaxID=54126 RepID=A0A2A6B7X7_PRIPA|nr:hypothetical protein PRIPAC_87955 [Pristionchus pacificus]|eukprot:PDM61989.1 hypothetical protein PRIPAC_51431 [Pristionchus pacificus]